MSPIPGRYHHSNIGEMVTRIPEDQLGNGHQAIEIALRDIPKDVDELQVTVDKLPRYYEIRATWVKP